jgi:hypothetical protein
MLPPVYIALMQQLIVANLLRTQAGRFRILESNDSENGA